MPELITNADALASLASKIDGPDEVEDMQTMNRTL